MPVACSSQPRRWPASSNSLIAVKTLMLVVLAAGLPSLAILPSSAIAQTNDIGIWTGETADQDKERAVNVSLIMPDVVAPSTPILKTPTDTALLTDNTPTFQWYGSTDNVAVTGYTLYIDGVVWLANLPTISKTTSLYSLVYDSAENLYSLTPVGSLSDGSHAWKVAAFDAASNATDSTTWSLRIDTEAPIFVITSVDAATVSISSRDSSTIPTTPIELTHNEPTISGTGEANSTVTMEVRRVSDDTVFEKKTFSIGSDGTWSVRLGTLERDVTYYLYLQIIDQAGLLSLLDKVPVLLPSIAIPLPWMSPEPGGDGTLPLTPPWEPVQRTFTTIETIVTEWTAQQLEPITQVYQDVQTTLIAASQNQRKVLNPIWYTHLFALIAVLLLPLLKVLLLSREFGRQLSLSSFAEIWRAVFWPDRLRPNLAISDQSQVGLPFTRWRWQLTSLDTAGLTTNRAETTVWSDRQGFFGLPEGMLLHADRHFGADDQMLAQSRQIISVTGLIGLKNLRFAPEQPPHLSASDWYRGQSQQLAMSPSVNQFNPLACVAAEKWYFARRSHRVHRVLASNPWHWSVLLSALALAIITPTLGNLSISACYGIGWLIVSWQEHQASARAYVYSNEHRGVAQAVIRLAPSQTLLHANDHGTARFKAPSESYQAAAIHHAYLQVGQQLNHDTDTNDDELIIAVQPLPTK